MRPVLVALFLGAALLPAARGADSRHFDDAALHAIQFLDSNEGWAVGDDGVVWHTIDGGRTWDRQATGVRASLRSVQFLTPFVGWIAGREELANGAGSVGVLLYTRDGGLKWQRLLPNALPGLNVIRFADAQNAFLLGDGADQYPSGVFKTTDGGRTWQPVPGPRAASWQAGDFQDGQSGALAGAWSRLATLRATGFATADLDTLGGRSLRGLQLRGNRALAVGQGGLVLTSQSAGVRWGYADLKLPAEVLATWDFHALHGVGDHVWVAGRPGSALLHSADRGATWQVVKTNQPLPLNAVFFFDEQRGWVVGEFGSILATTDGGKTWNVQRRGGQRAAVLFVHARAGSVPVDTVALLGGEEGYLAAALRVVCPDPNTDLRMMLQRTLQREKDEGKIEQAAELERQLERVAASTAGATQPERLAAATRGAAGAGSEALWQFPLPSHLAGADRQDLLKFWNGMHGSQAAKQLLRQMVLALRTWRPDVVITDYPDPKTSGCAADALVAEALHEAFTQAADPRAFPEQIESLGLEPWRVSKVYALWDKRLDAQVVVNGNDARSRLETTLREFAAPAAGLLAGAPVVLPAQRYYRLVDSRIEGAANNADLMGGVGPSPEGVARRTLPPVAEPAPEVVKAMRQRQTLQVLIQNPASGLANPDQLLSQLGPTLDGLPEDQAAAAALALANQYARLGQWTLAREAFLLMVDRYPAHPLSVEAYRWLVRYNTSSEARRRHEMGQFVIVNQTGFSQEDFRKRGAKVLEADPAQKPGISAVEQATYKESQAKPGSDSTKPTVNPRADGKSGAGGTEQLREERLTVLANLMETRHWYRGSLEIGKRLAGYGPLFSSDPSLQFCLQSARRNLGDFAAAQEWYAKFKAQHRAGPWHDAAAAELWLNNRIGPPPKAIAISRRTDAKPFLDGKLDDACWQGLKPMVLSNAAGDTLKEYATEAWFAHDDDFLYIALRCKHPAGQHVPPVKVRPRDADLRGHDRVSILLDLDRDYSTYFHLQIDQRGCVAEDCWGDASWNPKWFVAIHSDQTGWQIEAAIPLLQLTGDRVRVGTAWACNVVRILPGRGLQAWSLPADVQPRPEGMGLLLFQQDPARADARPAARVTP
jgi:photosystem II stability/assembly factor-like uncharacterized protein